MYKSRFESLGVYLPEKEVTTQELINCMKNKPLFDLEELTGIRKRRWRADGEDSYTMAIAAAEKCLDKSKYTASELDAIFFTSITKFKNGLTFHMEPSMSLYLKKALGLPGSAKNFDITNACAGMFTGVYILNTMIKAGIVKNGMIVSGECITPIAETAIKEIKDPIDEQFASLTVGDSGAAVIMDRSFDEDEGLDIMEFITLSEFSDLCYGMPSTENPGVAMYTKAMQIHAEVINRLPWMIGNLCAKYGVTGKDFDYVIPHQTSSRAIKTAFNLCGEYFDAIPEILISLDRFGNTSSTSHFVVLYDNLKKGKIRKGTNILFFALASGIVIGFISAKMGNLEVN